MLFTNNLLGDLHNSLHLTKAESNNNYSFIIHSKLTPVKKKNKTKQNNNNNNNNNKKKQAKTCFRLHLPLPSPTVKQAKLQCIPLQFQRCFSLFCEKNSSRKTFLIERLRIGATKGAVSCKCLTLFAIRLLL